MIYQNTVNLRDRDNLRRKDKRSISKVSFVRRINCTRKRRRRKLGRGEEGRKMLEPISSSP